jgi:hypothetical protein
MAGNRVQVTIEISRAEFCALNCAGKNSWTAAFFALSALSTRSGAGFIARCALAPRAALRDGAGARRKIYAGRVRSARLEGRRSVPRSRLYPAHARRRCAANHGCRKSRSEHKENCETTWRAREIALRKIHSAKAICRRNPRDGPASTGVWIAGCARLDTPDSITGWC